MQEPESPAWPEQLSGIGAVRFGRRSHHFEESVGFYRDLVGLRIQETFWSSFGADGVIFGLPGSSLTFELVRADEPPFACEGQLQLVLYFPNQELMDAARARLARSSAQAAPSHPYWQARAAVTYLDPDGQEVVFAPFVYGVNEPQP
jgi:catechol 2,3-dioxygenase-like lactoylglutathione lyase family enzyme